VIGFASHHTAQHNNGTDSIKEAVIGITRKTRNLDNTRRKVLYIATNNIIYNVGTNIR